MVMGGDSLSEDCGFKSRCHILDGHDIFTLISCKNCIVCLKRLKINEKEAGIGPFFNNCSLERSNLLTKHLNCVETVKE